MQKKAKREYAKFIAVAQIPLLPEQEESIAGWEVSDAEVWEFADTVVSAGYELCLSYSPEFAQYSACLKGVDPQSPNAGYWLYGNSTEVVWAVKVVLYKHFFIANTGKWNNGSTNKPRGRFS